MSWLVVARKDFRDTTRASLLWVLSTVFVLSLAAIAIGYTLVQFGYTFDGLLAFLTSFAGWFVPITALVVGYKAIVGERESGTIKVLLALPHTRADVVVGKVVGRAAAISLPVLGGFAITAGVVLALYGSFRPAAYLAVVLLSVALGVAFVSLAVAVSAATPSAVRAASGAIGAFVLFVFLWDLVPAGLYFLLNGSVPGSERLPAWYFLVEHLNPTNAYTALVTAVLPTLVSPMPSARPVYLADWFTLGLLLAWTVVPLGVGYARFRAAEFT